MHTRQLAAKAANCGYTRPLYSIENKKSGYLSNYCKMEKLKKVVFQNMQIIKICLLGIIICFQITNTFAQNQISYEEVTFEQFLKTKLENDSNFVKIVYQNLNYTKEARERFCLLYTSPSPRDQRGSRMPSSA